MKYFVKGWCNDTANSKKIMKEYENYYKSIEQQIPNNIKNVLNDRHDTYIVRSYFQGKNYVMKLEEKVWGKAYIVFQNAKVEGYINIEDDYWLYDEIYIVNEKYEIHIAFDEKDSIITCDNINIEIETKDYFKELYIKKDNNVIFEYEDKKDIANVIADKSLICGYDMLSLWEKIIISYIQICIYIKNYKYNNVEEILILYCRIYNLSKEEKEKMYKAVLSEFEDTAIKCILVLNEYKDEIDNKELNDIINEFLKVYNRKDVLLKNKNQLYLNLFEQISANLNKIYKSILKYIYNNFEKF